MKNNTKKRKKRAMKSEDASKKKIQGHTAETEFADLIGGRVIRGVGKQDVKDKNNKTHSVKSGEKKWQIFLYGEERFKSDNDIPGSEIFLDCINSFSNNWNEYKKNKKRYKLYLQPNMRKLKDFLSTSANKIKFLRKAFFDNIVNYLTIKDNNFFHIFDSFEVIEALNTSTLVVNSKARTKNQTDDLKVVFKLIKKDDQTTIGEIELRTDRKEKFRLVKFWIFRNKTFNLLREKIKSKEKINRIILYGKAIGSFKL